jgi:hypothetical protein
VDGDIETRKRRKIKDGMIVQYGAHRIKVIFKPVKQDFILGQQEFPNGARSAAQGSGF